MKKVYCDTETIGLCGPIKLIQYAIDDGPVHFIPFYRGWEEDPETCKKLLDFWKLIDDPDTLFIAFNASFDLGKLYNTFHRLLGYEYTSSERPIPPLKCRVLDLYIPASFHSPLAPFVYGKGAQNTPVAIRKVPKDAADIVAAQVEKKLRALIPATVEVKRHIKKIKNRDDLVTICWTIDKRMPLKGLMQVYGLKTLKLAEVWPLPEKGSEKPWLPYPDPAVHDPIELQCDEIMRDTSSPFWAYAELDIWFLKVLDEKLGFPPPDHHSTCTHIVAYTRYYGFGVDREVLLRTREAYKKKMQQARATLQGINLNSPKQKLALLRQYDPLIASSSKKVIKIIADSNRPSAPIAKAMMDFTMYSQRANQVEKVLECKTGRAHPTLRVMGTRTGRMAGEAGLNWQGICQAKGGIGLRAAMEVAGVGDWEQFEIGIAAALYPDAAMQEDLDHGVDAHSMNAVLMSPEGKAWAEKNGLTDILAAAKAFKKAAKVPESPEESLRKRMKGVSFELNYMGTGRKAAETMGVSFEEMEKMLESYYQRYQGFAAYRKRLEAETQTADTEKWDPRSVARMAREVTDITGFTMRWNFEAAVAEALWELGCKGIRTGLYNRLTRSVEKGVQTIDGAVKSALLGGALTLQQAVTRQRGNALIQASGSSINKLLQAQLWDEHRIPSLSCHDECVFPRHPNFSDEKVRAVITSVETHWRRKIKSLKFDYKPCEHWSDK